MLIGTQQYGWFQRYQKDGQDFRDHLDEIFSTLNRCGVQAWEGNLDSDEELIRLKSLLPRYGLQMPSVYTGGTLHNTDWPEAVDTILHRAALAQECGAKIVNINPHPKSWREPLAKNDDELKTQAEALQTLGEKLNASGMRLAFHFHSKELENSAREFHHMLLAVDEKALGLCMDIHWAYRGTGNSQLAVLDILKLYGHRATVLHLRQSRHGIWLETLDDGDVDYAPIVTMMKKFEFDGPAILEIAYERETEITLSMEEAYRRSVAWVHRTFA